MPVARRLDLILHRRGWCLTVVLVGAVLAACGGGAKSVGSNATTTSSTATSSPSSTTAATGTAACTTQQLSASFGTVGAGAGNRYVQVVLTNHGPAACSMYGYVGMQLLDANHQPVPTNVVRDGPGSPSTVVAPPGGKASGTLHWGAIPGPGESQTGPCEANPQQVEVTPPNQVQPLTIGWTFGPVCEQGHVDAGPLQLGVPAPG